MKRVMSLMGILITFIVWNAPAHSIELGPEIHIANGDLRCANRDDRGVLACKGIPYATPPIGALRWHAPLPPPNWHASRDASQFGARCLSALKGDMAPGPPRSEDCLSVNVWTPAHHANDARPVMVWIYGGGFEFGSSAEPSSDGSRLAAKGVVLVSFNYRVGVLGFLAHPGLDREGPSGDYGLQDQLAALRWVQSNIASFGGDPHNVTVFGESAGAHAIGILMASPLARGLMHKAIGESGAFWDSEYGSIPTFDEAHARGLAFTRQVGATSIVELRAMTAERVNAAAMWDFSTHPVITAFSPNIDGYVVPDVPATRFLRGEELKIPLLAGWNKVEQWPFRALALPHHTAPAFIQAVERMFGKDKVSEFLTLYPANDDDQAKESAEALAGDQLISEQTWQWLQFHRLHGGSPVYAYYFTYTSPYAPIAAHVAEVPFVFGTLTPQFVVGSAAPPSAADQAFSETIMSYWVNFAAHGDPNGIGLPHWPLYDDKDLVENLGKEITPQINLQAARFRFLSAYREKGALPARWRALGVPN